MGWNGGGDFTRGACTQVMGLASLPVAFEQCQNQPLVLTCERCLPCFQHPSCGLRADIRVQCSQWGFAGCPTNQELLSKLQQDFWPHSGFWGMHTWSRLRCPNSPGANRCPWVSQSHHGLFPSPHSSRMPPEPPEPTERG